MVPRLLNETRRIRWLPILWVVSVSYGCADLAAIRDFSKTSADSAAYTAIVTDYARSPDKRLAYITPLSEKAGERARLEAERKVRADQAAELTAVLKAVEAYMSAIGDLAADELVDPTTNVKALMEQLESAKVIQSQITKPATALASLLSKMVLDGYRQRQLRAAINAANTPLQEINRGLGQLFGEGAESAAGFPLSLRTDRTAVTSYYDYWTNRAKANKEAAAEELLRVKREQDLSAYGPKAKAIAEYRSVFQKIADGHQLLHDNQQNLANATLLRTIRQYAKEIRGVMKTVEAAK